MDFLLCAFATLSLCPSIQILFAGQCEDRLAVFFDGFIAEPPVHLIAIHERSDLILGMGVEETTANTSGQNSNHFDLVAQIDHHP